MPRAEKQIVTFLLPSWTKPVALAGRFWGLWKERKERVPSLPCWCDVAAGPRQGAALAVVSRVPHCGACKPVLLAGSRLMGVTG